MWLTHSLFPGTSSIPVVEEFIGSLFSWSKFTIILSLADNSLISIQPEEQIYQDQYFISFCHFLVLVKLENILEFIPMFLSYSPVGEQLENQELQVFRGLYFLYQLLLPRTRFHSCITQVKTRRERESTKLAQWFGITLLMEGSGQRCQCSRSTDYNLGSMGSKLTKDKLDF